MGVKRRITKRRVSKRKSIRKNFRRKKSTKMRGGGVCETIKQDLVNADNYEQLQEEYDDAVLISCGIRDKASFENHKTTDAPRARAEFYAQRVNPRALATSNGGSSRKRK